MTGRHPCSRLVRSGLRGMVLLALLGGLAVKGDAQERSRPDALQTGTVSPVTISPGGALWRAFLVPGWGHAAIGSYNRGAFYFALQGATLYTLARARVRIGEVESRIRFREGVLTRRLEAEGVTDPQEVSQRLEEDEALGDLEGLLESRQGQQEDLIAASLFFVLISGVDAFVSAHLAGFPEPLDLEAAPTVDGRLEMSLKLRIPN